MELAFEWDENKARSNRQKHRVTFEEACTVFRDPLALTFADDDHSPFEKRELIIGSSILGTLILASFTEISRGRIRIINARKATRHEKKDYEENSKTQQPFS